MQEDAQRGGTDHGHGEGAATGQVGVEVADTLEQPEGKGVIGALDLYWVALRAIPIVSS